MKRIVQCTILIVLLSFVSASSVSAQTVFPGAAWQTKSPPEVGMDATILQQMSTYIGGRGFVSRYGYQVYTWGAYTSRGDVASAAKPFYSTFLLKAVEDGLIPNLDTKAGDFEPCLNNLNASLGYKDRTITFRHLANQISGYQVREAPGTAYTYNDWQMALFWDTLFLKVYNTTYATVDASVLRPKLADMLQMQDNPTFMAFGTGDRPGRVAISPRDFVRFGLLYLNQGNWNGTQVVSKQHATMAVTSPLPNSIPRTAAQLAETCPGQRTIGSSTIPDNQTDHMGSYSYLWWTNGINRSNNRHWPDVSHDAYGAFGHGGKRAMIVIPSLDVIISWNDSPINSSSMENTALKLLTDSVQTAKPLPEQIIVDPYNPSYLVYNRDSNGNGRLDPFVMVGPGDPEGFLYRGTRNTDGTRNGDQMSIINDLNGHGANSIYMQIIRSHGGDGDSTHNPFLNNDPTQGLNQAVLDQWETWFDAMEQQGIVIYLFFYDDAINVSNNLGWPLGAGGNLHTQEQSFIEEIVNRFEHHPNLVWVVMEEVQEMGSDYVAHAKKIAEAIKQADDHDHLVGVHQLIGTTFVSGFIDDPNIEIFSVQSGTETSSISNLHSSVQSAWNNAQGRYHLVFAEFHGTKTPLSNGDRATLRRMNWAAALGGANLLWIGAYDSQYGNPTLEMKQDAGRFRLFMESTDFNTMVPHDELASGGTQYILANPGVSYIAYASNLSADMGIKGMQAGTYDFKWFDTVTGTETLQKDVNVPVGDQTWVKPVNIGNELAVFISTKSITPPSPTPSPSPTASLTPTPSGPTPTIDPSAFAVTIVDYQGLPADYPSVYDPGDNDAFVTGARVVNDRADTWTAIPSELSDKTRLLAARDDRGLNSPSYEGIYTVSVNKPVTVYVALDPRYDTQQGGVYPPWITSQGWTKTTLTANSSALSNWSIHTKDFLQGSIPLGVDSAQYDGVTYVFIPQSSNKPGDTDGDNDVDIFDYNAVITDFGKTGELGFSNADFDDDGDVDIFDYNVVISNFGQ